MLKKSKINGTEKIGLVTPSPGRSLNFSHMEVNIGIFDLGKPSHGTINPDYIPSGYILFIIMKEIKVPT